MESSCYTATAISSGTLSIRACDQFSSEPRLGAELQANASMLDLKIDPNVFLMQRFSYVRPTPVFQLYEEGKD